MAHPQVRGSGSAHRLPRELVGPVPKTLRGATHTLNPLASGGAASRATSRVVGSRRLAEHSRLRPALGHVDHPLARGKRLRLVRAVPSTPQA